MTNRSNREKNEERKEQEPMTLSTADLKLKWYTAGEGAKRLSENSGREIDSAYLNKLGQLNKIRTLKVHERLTLYSKADVDVYVVETRGAKSGRAKRKGKSGPTVRELRREAKEPEKVGV